jgi:hypothetical protein
MREWRRWISKSLKWWSEYLHNLKCEKTNERSELEHFSVLPVSLERGRDEKAVK